MSRARKGPRRSRVFPLLLLGLTHCGSDTEAAVELAAEVIDRAVQVAVREFRVTFVAAQTRDEKPVRCRDFPGTLRLGSPNLVTVADRKVSWPGSSQEAKVSDLRVPAQERLVLVVRGFSPFRGRDLVIARGCLEGQIFGGGREETVRVGISATVGAACLAGKQCEAGLTCHQATAFPQGYCTLVGCTADRDCPASSRCVTGGSGGSLCLRSCVNLRDCAGQQCKGRRTPGGQCSQPVCVPMPWDTGGSC